MDEHEARMIGFADRHAIRSLGEENQARNDDSARKRDRAGKGKLDEVDELPGGPVAQCAIPWDRSVTW